MRARPVVILGAASLILGGALIADIVPPEVQQPGTQPGEVGALESPDKCDNCHGGYSQAVEPAFNWRGSMMANAGRDPLFWATLAVAEQDFDGAGDLCIRCHSPAGWTAGRSTPTDGSALDPKDADGVQCDLCHTMTNPNGLEHLGVQNAPFVANDGSTPPEGYYGSGMYVLLPASDKLGPYNDAEARHQFQQSLFHRDGDFCGTCHDVSNPVVGDLAPSAGTQPTADPVTRSGAPGGDVSTKAAFNNFPFQYGIVERTFSEFRSGVLDDTPVSEYPNLPAELRGGAIEAAYTSAIAAGTNGNYADDSTRTFTCQTCHMRPVAGTGCNKQGAPQRLDLPLHDMTGGNYWVPEAIRYLDQVGRLRLGGGLSATQVAALDAGRIRALKQLGQAAGLFVNGDVVRIVNRTGHKLISGYPEGRRMWLNVKWYDGDGVLVREDGAYGSLTVQLDGVPTPVRSLLDPYDPNATVFEAHYAMTQAWAAQLLDLGYPTDLPLTFDRLTGAVQYTLGDLGSGSVGSYLETFHFVLNDKVAKDNRIPPYQMSYDEARRRNALPVPATQYGNPGPGGVYEHFAEITLAPPATAAYATVDLLYQPTSWEYIQFLYLANRGTNPFLADEGAALLEAWQQTGMAEPYTMAQVTWGTPPEPPVETVLVTEIATWCVGRKDAFTAPCDTFRERETVGITTVTQDATALPLSGSQVFAEIRDGGNGLVTTLQGFSDESGEARMTWRVPRRQAAGLYTVNIVNVLSNGREFDPAGSTTTATFIVQ